MIDLYKKDSSNWGVDRLSVKKRTNNTTIEGVQDEQTTIDRKNRC